ncbi:alpha/beta fold hydrolase [Mycolicibacterium bacteremicum]|uniref:Alpha/beta hydrolase n=1 Tax=Mycolicibacterium bacteremicum TaxID=564198 RepID=A0A1W9YRC0_MYCBA|nr:alpha/beta hydrolase [Mycolicibacterium bacteremicum]MCV7430077.1 alpha/beta hydrolase [Mycolicibacterium bacteremicum]ORA02584.1 alpha/beta hydrolase [Mycolicibacterium bacteremicum]
MTISLAGPDGTELVAEVTGSGPPVVFVHGSNGDLNSWADIAGRLTGYRVVRYTRRNHPPSGIGPAPNSFDAEAGDLHAVLGSVGRAHVVGASYGATVALHAALADSSRVASLALFEPPLLLTGARLAPAIEQYQRLFTTVRYADALELFLREAAQIPDDVLASGPPIPDDPVAAMSALADLEAMAGDDGSVQRWAAISVPVLLMQGGASWPPLPEGMDALAAALPTAQRVVWDEHSHFATVTAPELVAEAVQEFLDGLA